MSIRSQVFINIIAVFVVLVSAAFLLSRFFILRNLEVAEEDIVTAYVETIHTFFINEIHSLDSTTLDWASWDDTYEFIQNRNQEFIDSNILSNPFTYLELNMMIFLDLSGHIVYTNAYDLESDEYIPIPPIVQTYFSENYMNFQTSKEGLVMLPDFPPLMMASRPIFPSYEDKPSAGTLILGRFITSSVLGTLNIYSNSDLSLYSAYDNSLPEHIRDVLSAYSLDRKDIIVKPLNDRFVAGYLPLSDINDNVTLILKLETPRDVYQQGQAGINVLLTGLGSLSIIILVFVMIITNKVGLSRLGKLSEKVDEIGSTGNISERIAFRGNDEIDSLARNINGMLSHLQVLYEKQAELTQQLEKEMTKRVDFMRALVHELRTPLTPILTTSDMLLERDMEEPDRSMIVNIHRGAVRLNKRISELLDFVRGEVGGLEVKITSVNPAELINEAVNEMQQETVQRKKSIQLEMPDSLPEIAADEDRLKQVLTNLIDNALKYSVRGDTIQVQVTTDSDNLTVVVQDHGPGISGEDQKKLFTRYSRVTQDGRSVGGLGIGLSLCKNIIDLHHGEIWVKSRSGEGSLFGFSIPLGSPVSERKE